MKFLEKDLEEIIWEQLQTTKGGEELLKRGLYTNQEGKHYRQLRLGSYGVADLVSISRSREYRDFPKLDSVHPYLDITVYELKKDKISMSAFLQAIGYCKAIKRYVNRFRGKDSEIRFTVVLVGYELDVNSSFSYLPDIINSEEFSLLNYKYEFGIDGLQFSPQWGYALKEEEFKL